MTEITLSIGGMGCDACCARIEKALLKLNGIKSASVNLASQKAAVTYDPDKLQLSSIKEAITDEGYEVTE
ncbi:MAG: copper ion binding protein [Spirochaetes bacterium]|nr:copper ion binding protein [Spirochaetota bacterium]